MSNPNEQLISALRKLIAEEMFLLGQELDDSLEGGERRRLAELSGLLDQAGDLLLERSAAHGS